MQISTDKREQLLKLSRVSHKTSHQLKSSFPNNLEESGTFRLKDGRVHWKGYTCLTPRISCNTLQKLRLFPPPDMTNRFFATAGVTQRGHGTIQLLPAEGRKTCRVKSVTLPSNKILYTELRVKDFLTTFPPPNKTKQKNQNKKPPKITPRQNSAM